MLKRRLVLAAASANLVASVSQAQGSLLEGQFRELVNQHRVPG